jgi:drug/metabolite transporter (DMT)-like permease
MGKLLLRELPTLQVSWLRYCSALLSGLCILLAIHWRRPHFLTPARETFLSRNLPWITIMGLVSFFASPVVQYEGLNLSTSTANVLIVAMEPVITVILAWILVGEKIHGRQAVAFGIALVGFWLLSRVGPEEAAGPFGLISLGNLLLLVTIPMDAAYTVVSRKLAGRISPISLFTASLGAGFFLLTGYLFALGPGLPHLGDLSLEGWLALLSLGPIGTAATYVFWTLALGRATVAAVALTLFVQPILGTAFGMAFLGERLGTGQAIGAALILAALALQTLYRIRRGKT